jgi:ABC-type multidrug transport system fused ATPase/permease subunit
MELLTSRDKQKLLIALFLQFLVNLLDLLGVAIFGVIGSIAISGVSGRQRGLRVSQVLEKIGLENFSLQSQVASLGIVAVLVFLFRSALSIVLTRRTLKFLSRKSSEYSHNLFVRLLSLNISQIEKRQTSDLQYSLTSGVSNIFVGVIGSFMTLFADLTLVILLLIGILTFDPITALSTVIVFGITSISLSLILPRITHKLAVTQTAELVRAHTLISISFVSIRELLVRDGVPLQGKRFFTARSKFSNVSADLTLLPIISKYAMESSLIAGALAVAFLQFFFKDAPQAFAGLAIFLASATRIAPAIMRIQQSYLQVRSFWGQSLGTVELMKMVEDKSANQSKPLKMNLALNQISKSPGKNGKYVVFDKVNFTYPGAPRPSLINIDLCINSGEFLAITGKSGAGKSTLVDLLIGGNSSDTGNILIDGLVPKEFISLNPGKLAYVPQEISLFDGSLFENLALGLDSNLITEETVWNALNAADLSDFVNDLPEKIYSNIGESGSRLSGGQRQRLGIARSLLTNPKILILDEATSALDGETEQSITDKLLKLRSSTTLIVIAHRLSTVMNADRVIYLEDGALLAQGSFEAVRNSVPNFDRQAQLMGL